MDEETIKSFLNQKVKILLDNGYIYSGEIVKIGSTDIFFLDKFGSKIAIGLDIIKMIKPEEEN